ncbi:hypothetical protein RRG08_036130 [Elysia crispata]|uniref:Uncharacterized protein n=1 Tax=Elysia crispata TaxID=231223 RepID=A0AAE0ZJJ8_9GAST|nr:hypothetical protein RRG08_036130 [Elysia crispata]
MICSWQNTTEPDGAATYGLERRARVDKSAWRSWRGQSRTLFPYLTALVDFEREGINYTIQYMSITPRLVKSVYSSYGDCTPGRQMRHLKVIYYDRFALQNMETLDSAATPSCYFEINAS